MNLDLFLAQKKAKLMKKKYFKKVFDIPNPTKGEIADYFENNKRGEEKDKIVQLKNIGKIYSNGYKAVHDFNLEVKPKEFVAFLGPSGCGKTTILRMIAGLEYISEGELTSNEVILNSAKPSDRGIAMVFQNYALYPYMNVYNNIAFGLKLKTNKNPLTMQYSRILKELKNPGSTEISNLKHLIWMLKNPLHSELIGIKNEIKKMKKMRGSSAMVKKLNIGKQEILEKIAELKIKNQKEIKEIKERIEEIKIIEGSINLPLTLEMKELKNQIKNDKNIAKNKQRISEIQKELAILKQKHKEAIKVSSDKLVESMVIWKASIPERVRRITELIGIDNYLNSKPMELSGGQRQRVALARSISRDANIFLYDEPLSNLDAKLRVTMRVEVRKLHDMLGAISIYVTHDQVEAMSMADKIVVINKGYIQQVGSPKEMFDQPANLFVAKFIGTPSINQLNGKLDLEGVLSIGKHIFDYASPQELKKNIEKYHGKDIYLCFRPQDVQLVGSTSKAKNVIKGEVIIKEMLGYEHSLVVKTKDLGEVNIVVNKNNDISVGETISFKINKENIHLFDKETEISLTSVLNDATKKAHKIMFNSNIEVIKNKITMQKSKNKRTFSQKQLDKCVAIVSKVKREKLENDKKEMQTLIKELKAEIEEK